MDRGGADYVKVDADDDNDDENDIILADDEIDVEDEFASLQDADPLHDQAKSTDQLQRQLNNRQIQLFAIGGSIGTALFVSIGDALQKGGPGSLLLAFALQSLIVACVNNCMAEMGVLFPVSGGFIRMAGKWVDDALGFMAGYNFFLLQALIIPFEITALNLILGFWSDNIPIAAVCTVTILCYAALNTLAVRTYGEAEFWLSGGKFILICILFLFTLITTLGGNPKHDAYGFRYWDKPGAFAEYLSTGSLGRFEGFLACLWTAAFTVCGPEYIAMVAAEAKHPRVYMKAAYESVYLRFGIFFVGGALCTGLVIPYNDPQLLAALTGADGGEESAAASPYVIAMTNLGISILPHIVNALLVTSVFSAGNTCTYCATRSLYGLALDGRAPRFLRYCTSNGVPIACFAVVICFPFLSFLAVTRTSAQVLSELVSLVTAAALIDYIVICITYLRFYYATQAQGVQRSSFPYVGRLQPFCGWAGLVGMVLVTLFYGYTAFRHPTSVAPFFFHYAMVIVNPLLYFGYKLFKMTQVVPLQELDLVWERPVIDAYEAGLTEPPTTFSSELAGLFKRTPKKEFDEGAIPMLPLRD